MSARREAVSGDHSAGLRITVLPAASAGATFQVASISGAFHGVISTQGPAGSQLTWLVWPRVVKSSWPSVSSQSAKKRKLWATRGITPRRCERRRAPLSVVSTAASSSSRLSTPSATACRMRARSARGVAAQEGKAAFAAATAASASLAVPREISPIVLPSIGETSVNVSVEATRRPPIQCRLSTRTPATMILSTMGRAPVRKGGGEVGGAPRGAGLRRRATMPRGRDQPGRGPRPITGISHSADACDVPASSSRPPSHTTPTCR